MLPGLVSITFRQLTPEQVIELCVQNQLQVIEWGGDVHVPHGDTNTAERTGHLTRQYGLNVAAYGSYYRLGASYNEGLHFSSVLASAVALETKSIRVWAGNRGSKDAGSSWRDQVVQDALRCADMAAEYGISICYEFHADTLTDTLESTCDLLAATIHPFIKTLWQPPHNRPLEECLKSLRAIASRLHHVHCFHWWPDSSNRHPLRAGKEQWTAYISELQTLGVDANILLEFVLGDSPDALVDDALFLNEMLAR